MSLFSFKDVCQDVTKTATKIPTSEYLEKGKYEIFDQGKSFVAGYTNNSLGIANDFPYIVFGDHTRVVKYVDVPCFIGADGVKLLKVRNSNFVSKYIYYTLLNYPITSQGYSRHFKFLKECLFVERNIDEQNRIVAELDKIQRAIDNKRQQLAKLDELVNSKFYEMFGDPIANPKGWERNKLKVIAPESTSNYNPQGKFWLLNLDMIESNTGHIIEKVYSSEKGNSTFAFDTDIVLYSKLRPYLNKVVVPDECGFATTELVPLKPDKRVLNKHFLSMLLRTDQFVQFANAKSSGAKMPRMSLSELRNFPCIIPPLELQEQFANFAQKIERAKDVVSKQIDRLQELLDSRMDFYFRQ